MPGACSLEENVRSPGKATTGSFQLPYEWEVYLAAREEQPVLFITEPSL